MKKKKEISFFIENHLKDEIKKKNLNKIGVAVSGGPDSIALLHLLKGTGIELIAFHCNFNLRGAESIRDEMFVTDICRKLNIELKIKDFNTLSIYDNSKGKSIEMICRELRYEWFNQALLETGIERIAIGHNADDNIETFFLNLLRGCGTSGLKGINPDNGFYWRPLLKFHRHEILEYLKLKNLDYIIDSSNLQSDFRRNYLRNEIIPLFRKEWKGFDKAMTKTIGFIQNENKIIENQIASVLNDYQNSLPISKIIIFPDPVLLIRKFIEKLNPFNTTAEEIYKAILANKPHNKKWVLAKGSVLLTHQFLILNPLF